MREKTDHFLTSGIMATSAVDSPVTAFSNTAASEIRGPYSGLQPKEPSSSQPAVTPKKPNFPHDMEESQDAYKPRVFHPVYIGDIFHCRYRILRKMDDGKHSTVWLVRDLHEE